MEAGDEGIDFESFEGFDDWGGPSLVLVEVHDGHVVAVVLSEKEDVGGHFGEVEKVLL